MKTHIKKVLYAISKLSFIQNLYKGKGSILMFHRIAPLDTSRIQANENLKISPEFLDSFIQRSLLQGYHFISIDELYEGLIHNKLKDKFLCITIDDGYKDNLEYGFPIFDKYNIPFCIYVCTSFPESSHNMWWFGLEDYLLENEKLLVGGGDREHTRAVFESTQPNYCQFYKL